MKLLATTLCLVSIAASAQGYQRQKTPGGACLYLPEKTFTWYLDSAGNPETPFETELIATSAAFSTWQTAAQSCSDFTFIEGGKRNSARVEYVSDGGLNHNVIIFRQKACSAVVPSNDPCLQNDSCANVYNCWKHGEFAVSLPTTTFNQSTGEILDVDIELNTANFIFTTVDSPKCVAPNFNQLCVATDVQNVMTAMIGKAIGLAHVSDPASTLSAATAPGETSKRVIDPGTLAGFCAIYPSGRRATLCDGGSVPEPIDAGAFGDAGVISDAGMTCSGSNCATQKPGCGCTAAEPGALLLGAVVLLLRRRRRD